MAKREKISHASYASFFTAWRQNPMGRGQCRGRASFDQGEFVSYSTLIGKYFPEIGVYLSTTARYSPTTTNQQCCAESRMRSQAGEVVIINVPRVRGEHFDHHDNKAWFKDQYRRTLTQKYVHETWRERRDLLDGGLLKSLNYICEQMKAYSHAFDLAWSVPDAAQDAEAYIKAYFDPARQARLAASREKNRLKRERQAMVEMLQGKREMGDLRPRRNMFGERMVRTNHGWQYERDAA